MDPILLPIKVPNIKKYNDVVMAGGKMVCGHILKNRFISLKRMVVNAILATDRRLPGVRPDICPDDRLDMRWCGID
jgi:hypothetical protein